jgi:mercuric ion binding protein
MRKILLTAAAITMLATAAQAETIKASVNGLVCSFCATGIEKTFKAQAAVDHVKVDLESKLVTIGTKDGQTMDDATVTKLITDAGYTVTNINREK